MLNSDGVLALPNDVTQILNQRGEMLGDLSQHVQVAFDVGLQLGELFVRLEKVLSIYGSLFILLG